MLVLTRKPGEEVVIGDSIRITVAKLEGARVRLGIQAPRQVSIRRQELPKDHLGINRQDGELAG